MIAADDKVQDIVCYPDQADWVTVVSNQPTATVDNKGIQVLDDSVAGPDVAGNLTISGSNAIVSGQGRASPWT